MRDMRKLSGMMVTAFPKFPCSLQVHISTIDFLYIDLITLLKLFIPNNLIVDLFRLYVRLHHLQIKIVLLFSFLIFMTFISFSCPTVLAIISSTILNKSGETENASLVPDLVKAFNLPPLSVMLTSGFS